jgi:hypothetical protein
MLRDVNSRTAAELAIGPCGRIRDTMATREGVTGWR